MIYISYFTRHYAPFKSGLCVYAFTMMLVFTSVFLAPSPGTLYHPRASVEASAFAPFARWDGEWFAEIASQGYNYDPRVQSRVAFFPLFPLLGWLISRLTGMGPVIALLVVAHASLVGGYVLMAEYEGVRSPKASPGETAWVVLAACLLPHTFFQRMAYSESLFLLLCVLTLLGMEKQWPLMALTAFVALATATRAVGLCLLPPLALHVWWTAPSWQAAIRRLILVLPLGSTGLLAFMGYQQIAFGEATAFFQTQTHWNFNRRLHWSDRLMSLAAYEPLWSIANPESPCGSGARVQGPLSPLSPPVLDRVAFVMAAATLGVGLSCRWLTGAETALSMGLLILPYLTRGHEMCMVSMGRFTSVIFPLTLLQGRLIARLPLPLRVAVLLALGLLLGYAAHEFAAGAPFL